MQGTTTQSTLIFGFLISFLGIFALGITAGVVWPQMRLALARRYGIFQMQEEEVGHQPIPALWDVCVQEAMSCARVSESAWKHLHPLALLVGPAEDPCSAGTSKRAKRKWKLRAPFQTRRRDPAEEEMAMLCGRDSSVAVVIAMPSCTTKDEHRLSEFALGVAQTRCYGYDPDDDG